MRYFFNQMDGEVKLDDEGVDLDSFGEARLEAVRYAASVLRDHPTLVWTGQDFRVEVTDINKLILFTVIVVGVDAPAAKNLSASILPPDRAPGNVP